MEILDLRHFGSADLRPLLDEESSVWLSSLSWDYRSSADMILRYVDARILPGFAAIERGRLYGYCFFVYEGAKGVIGDMFVETDSFAPERRHEIELQLLRHTVDTLQQSPGIRRVEAQLLIHSTGTMAKPFVEEGFRRFPRLFLSLPIDGRFTAPRHDLSFDIEIHRWTDADYQPAASIITNAYRGHVDSEVNDQYRTVAGSLRFLNNIVRFPGCGVFDPQSSFVAYHKPTRQRIGVLLCSRVKEDVGHITQVCLIPEFRNYGIGEHMIRECYSDLAARRFSQLTLTVTEANTKAVELYRRLGFQHVSVFDAFVWEG